MEGRCVLLILTDMNIKQLKIDRLTMMALGIENNKDVTVREDADTGEIYIFSSSGMAKEIEKLEQLKGKE